MHNYICDIDGTLADNSHRNPYDENKVYLDTPLPTVEVIKALIKNGDNIIFFSGRTRACYHDTYNWLEKYVVKYPELYMREIGDNRSDSIVKKEMFDLYIPKKVVIHGVFDDRLRVCKMWYEMGLFVFNCNQGLKEF